MDGILELKSVASGLGSATCFGFLERNDTDSLE